MPQLLLIEDDEDKSAKLIEFIESEFPDISIELARSLNSGLRQITSGRDRWALVLLDMSMPNFDVAADEPGGGTPENFAGASLLAQMKLRGIFIPTIVVSMFDSFGKSESKISLDRLSTRLQTQYEGFFKGYVYYSAAQEGWQDSLRRLMKSII